jgi:F-type H+-transporting ATPase subunit b
MMKNLRSFLATLALVLCLAVGFRAAAAQSSQQPPAAAQNSATASPSASNADQPAGRADKDQADKKDGAESAPPENRHISIGHELAKETRVAEGDEPEEHSDLKHSAMVRRLARITGLSVHGAHILALVINFVLIVILVVWAVRKTVPGVMRSRDDSIQKALQEARKASEEAGQRLSDIENRLKQMDAEIGRMQSSAEKEAEGEEARIKQAAEDDMHKVVESAKQEIDAAAKQVRRELSAHTADLALALARKQINVDVNTDQVLVRNFAARLAEPGKPQGNGGGKDGH